MAKLTIHVDVQVDHQAMIDHEFLALEDFVTKLARECFDLQVFFVFKHWLRIGMLDLVIDQVWLNWFRIGMLDLVIDQFWLDRFWLGMLALVTDQVTFTLEQLVTLITSLEVQVRTKQVISEIFGLIKGMET